VTEILRAALPEFLAGLATTVVAAAATATYRRLRARLRR
jgi:hypothetical protein